MGRMRAAGAALGAVAVGAVGALAWAARDMPAAFGGDPTKGARGDRIRLSPRYRDGVFHNVHEPASPAQQGPSAVGIPQIAREMLFGEEKDARHPSLPIPLVRDGIPKGESDGQLAVTWLGHSTALLEIEGKRILLDPVWSEGCSPSQSVGPRRMHEPPVPLADLPPVDAVVISHDHYDHLDMRSVRELARTRPELRFVVPLGVGAHLERWGIGPERFDELDWEEEVDLGGVRAVSTSAQHFSGRGFANDGTLWSSWAFIGAEQRAFYSGDTGYFEGFAETGERYGPFDLSLVQIGAYSDHWRSVHMTPEEGVSTHLDVNRGSGDPGSGLLVPVHWGTFVLGLHAWSEPVERLCADADERGVRVAVPRPGERVEAARAPKLDHWWRAVA
ncbi:MBL fold metallo-hydrolase [Streptacidiphilus sp. EB103A]|uniref:MBL fold metallo-hydrolase n=1 Tax=Streptacidiphilus sp. EB103A TaxID=3156275 RepID=UPI0035146482